MPALLLFALIATASPQRVLVLDISGEALTPAEAALVRDALAAELAKARGVEVLTTEDVRRVLDVEADKREAGCETNTDACLAELGAALGASRVLHGSATRLGETFVLSVALVDPASARAVGRTTVKAGSVEELIDRAPLAVEQLRPQKPGGGVKVLTITGGTVATLGALSAAAFGVTLFVLYDATQNPRGDPQLKQSFLDNGEALGITAIASAGIGTIGLGLLGLGLVIE